MAVVVRLRLGSDCKARTRPSLVATVTRAFGGSGCKAKTRQWL